MLEFLSPQATELVQFFCVAAGIGLVLAAAVIDARSFRIPNRINLALLATGLLFAVVTPDFQWVPSLALMVMMFFVGAVLFQFRLLGGGDVKLLAVVSFWAGLEYLMGFVFFTAVAGGVVSAVYLARAWLRSRRAKAANPATDFNILKESVPYGVAIAAGSVYVFISIVEHLELVVGL